MAFVIIDTETTGLDAKVHHLLTAHLMLLDNNFIVLDEYTVAIKSMTGNYIVDPKALAVNKIALDQHHAEADEYPQAVESLESILALWSAQHGALIPVGWNVEFDIKFLRNVVKIDRYISYRKLDMQSVFSFWHTVRSISSSLSLVQVAKLYGIDTTKAHSAAHDCYMVHQLMLLLKGRLSETQAAV